MNGEKVIGSIGCAVGGLMILLCGLSYAFNSQMAGQCEKKMAEEQPCTKAEIKNYAVGKSAKEDLAEGAFMLTMGLLLRRRHNI